MTIPSGKIGDYTIVRPLGKGGMGDVYLAQDPAIGRLVAIKLLKSGLDDPDARERFAREARSAGRLRHPNIVTLFHVGEHESRPYIVMEYIPGSTLADVIRGRAPLTFTRKLRIIEDVCRGLEHAHRFGVVHRDIKPANVIVDSDGMVKILDFGIARVSDQTLTGYGVMVGTPNYMSPEQILNPRAADQRTDVFAVGLVLYELLTYRRAFPGDGYEVLHQVVNNEIDPIEAAVPGVDDEVATILRQAVEKNPRTTVSRRGTVSRRPVPRPFASAHHGGHRRSDRRRTVGSARGPRGASDRSVGAFTTSPVPAAVNPRLKWGATWVSNEFVYRAGTEIIVSPRLTTTIDLLGRSLRDAGRLEYADTTWLYTSESGVTGSTVLRELAATQKALGLMTLAAGGKFNLRSNFLLSSNLLVSLTNTGLTARVTPTVGLEYAF